MSDQHFDLSYSGLIRPGADPAQARRLLTDAFRLSDQDAARLFSGRPMLIKRGVDAATAARVEQVFARAGAVLTVRPAVDPDAQGRSGAAVPTGTPVPSRDPDLAASRLTLAPPGELIDHSPVPRPPALDLSRLSLVPGDDWTLTDCIPPPVKIPVPDTSRLTLAPILPRVEYPHDPELD